MPTRIVGRDLRVGVDQGGEQVPSGGDVDGPVVVETRGAAPAHQEGERHQERGGRGEGEGEDREGVDVEEREGREGGRMPRELFDKVVREATENNVDASGSPQGTTSNVFRRITKMIQDDEVAYAQVHAHPTTGCPAHTIFPAHFGAPVHCSLRGRVSGTLFSCVALLTCAWARAGFGATQRGADQGEGVVEEEVGPEACTG